ncbi:MAG TPA: YIP1 family protein [Gemmatimonas sp.]|nr:YIP1 family protein [Gemmatimonas sp.]
MTVPGEATTPVAKGGLFEDFVDAFVRPRALFERNSNSSFVRPALVQSLFFLVIGIAAMNLVAPYFEAEMLRTVRQNGQPMPENGAAVMGTMAKVTSTIGFAVAPWMVALLGGLATWIATRIIGARLSFGQSAMIAAWSYTPAMLGTVLMAVQGALVDPSTIRGVSDAQLGPARFVDPETTQPVLLALLQQLDVFNLWGLVITAIGIMVVGRQDLGTSVMATAIRFALVALGTIVPALLR